MKLNKNTLLFLATLILFGMVGFRIIYSSKLYYLFLIWNTFLASIPYAISQYTKIDYKRKMQTFLLVGISILFLPNALYLISDFEHLAERAPVPYFFDILLMFYASLLGLLFNVFSLQNLQEIFQDYVKPKTNNILITGVIILSGFGVYLGRYLRWNSWDIITHPKTLLLDCAHRFLQPHLYTYTWSVTIGYAFILGFGYVVFNLTKANKN